MTRSRLLRFLPLWYWFHALTVFMVWKFSGLLTLVSAPDSSSYALGVNLSAALSSPRTLGYPIFLNVVSWLSPDFSLLPDIQFVLYSIGVFIFLLGLRYFGIPRLKSLISIIPLFYLQFAKIYVPYQLTESLAVTFAICVLGLLLILISHPRKLIIWTLICVGIFCTYQIRPAFLFMIPLIPSLGIGLWYWKHYCMEFNGLTVQRFGVYLTLVSLLPLLAFSTLRFALVDHFGLVSFGGFNIVGIASQMLTKELVVNLPDRDRELAISIIERRDEDRKVISNAGSYPDDHPLIVNNIPLECTRPMPMIFRDWVNCYNYHIWLLSVPLSAERTGHGNIVEVNRELKSLSKHIIAANPKLYFTWLLRAFGDSFFWLPRIDVLVSNASKVLTLVVIMELIFQLYADMASHFRKMGKATLILSLVVLGATTALLAGTGATKGIATAAFNFVFESSFWISLGYILMVGVVGIMVLAKPDIKEFRYLSIFAFAENLYLILIALGYFLFGILLVIAVEPPISRYLMAVYTFFPSLFLVQAYSMVARRFAQFRLLINRTK